MHNQTLEVDQKSTLENSPNGRYSPGFIRRTDALSVKQSASTSTRFLNQRHFSKRTLPPSFDNGDQITDAVRGFPNLEEHRLPRLKDIKLGGGLRLNESVKVACEEVGTSVVEL